MKQFFQRSLFTGSVFAIAACFALTGCTDALVSPDDTLETTQRVVTTPEVGPDKGTSFDTDDIKLIFRNAMPFPNNQTAGDDDEASAESDSTNSKLVFRSSMTIPLPDSAAPGDDSASEEGDNDASENNSKENNEEESSEGGSGSGS